MANTIRAFIAIELTDSVIMAIKSVQNNLKSYGFKIRWVVPENIHLTMAFLGDIPILQVEKVCNLVMETARKHIPITLFSKGLGVFPSINRPRIIWAGVAGELDNLAKIKKNLDFNLQTAPELNYIRDNRSFRAHLTLGRVKKRLNQERLITALRDNREFLSEKFIVDKLHVFKSTLTSSGSLYEKLS